MCGIVSVIRKEKKLTLYKEQTDIFKQMLYADALRGWDSTGIAAIKQNNSVKVVKDACPPASLFHRVQDNEWMFGNEMLVGHNRAATKGKTNKENAHPFQEEHITLVHNGTLRFHHHLKNVEVDSHAITHSMVERGTRDTLEMLDGAFALVWYDAKEQLLYAARNDQRPLHLLETEDMFILSSEQGLAQWVCTRNNQKIKKAQLLTSGLLYSFKTNRKGIRYVDTSRFQPYVYKAPQQQQQLALPNKKTIDTNTGEVLPFPTNRVSKIQPYADKEDFEGLEIGHSIDVLAFKRQDLNYSCFGLGKHRWLAESIQYPNLMIEFYTDSTEDFADCVVNIRISRMYFSPGLKQNMVVGENPIIPKKKIADESGPMRTSNGVEVTDQVVELCKDKECEGCGLEFRVEKGMTLAPIVLPKDGQTYNYRYTCTDCTEYFDIMGRKAN